MAERAAGAHNLPLNTTFVESQLKLGIFSAVSMITFMQALWNFWKWLWSLQDLQKTFNDPAQRLLQGMTVTARCRYNASIRLKRLGAFSFYTTIILSLGLILIPLLQNSDIRLDLSVKVLNMLQIFLAVAVLVYSVVNGTAKYEVRSEKLNECGDRIKELIRDLRADISKWDTAQTPIDMNKYHQRYFDVSTDSENHTRADHSLAVVRTPEYYSLSGISYAWEYIRAIFPNLLSYIVPVLMILAECIFISDMLGITHQLSRFLVPVAQPS